MKNVHELESKIETLEIKLAYQEHTITTLNDEIARQQREIESVSRKVTLLLEKLNSMQPSNIAKASEETPPPHY